MSDQPANLPAPLSPPRPSRIADSPLFWLYLFGIAALAGLLIVGPKYARRQARLELQRDVREDVWKERVRRSDGLAGGNADSPDASASLQSAADRNRGDSERSGPGITLLPLLAVIGTVTALLAITLVLRGKRVSSPANVAVSSEAEIERKAPS